MKGPIIATIVGAICLALLSPSANAQAARTWVSGVGDDGNFCTRTQPCKTFAGAFAKTEVGGEINCLDPGGFGALTITNGISIICQAGTAGVQAQNANAIIVNAGPADVVYLQGLDLNGLIQGVSGLSGISFTRGAALFVKDCTIQGFGVNGIDFAPNGVNATLVVQDTTIYNNLNGGILVAPTGGATASVTITNTHMDRNKFGLRVQDGTDATVFNSTAANNTSNGFLAASSLALASLFVSHSLSYGNGVYNIAASGSGASVTLFDVASYRAGTAGIFTTVGGVVSSTNPATNHNLSGGAPNGLAIPLQ